MSKLILRSALIFLTVSSVVFSAIILQAQNKKSKNNAQTERSPIVLNEETRLWGKATGPIQLRIDFKEQHEDQVTLVATIRSSTPQLKIEWILPAGVALVSGQRQETLLQAQDTMTYQKEITVKVQWPLQKPHLVLRAITISNGKPRGASTVFNLDPSIREMEKEDIIKAHMQSRKIHKLVK